MAAASMIQIKKGSETENFYRFCRVLIDIGNKIAQDYVTRKILNSGYCDINDFFIKNRDIIENNPSYSDHLNGVRRSIEKTRMKNNNRLVNTLDEFDSVACASIIQNILAWNHGFTFDYNNPLIKLRELRNYKFGHTRVFKMSDNEFEEAINQLDRIFSNLTKNYWFRDAINKVMNESIINVKQYFEKILEDLSAKIDGILNEY
jgi:hypothetical protein